MLYVIIGLIILASLLLWGIILIQNPKGGLSSQFGGSSVTNIIGAQKSGDVMEKATWIMGIVIAILVLVSSYITTPREIDAASGLQDRADEAVIPTPAATPAEDGAIPLNEADPGTEGE